MTAAVVSAAGQQAARYFAYCEHCGWQPIPESELPFVKQKFYKGSSKARGSGIGLAVCDEIVRLHNGNFTIGNAEGGGTVVTISLPIGK